MISDVDALSERAFDQPVEQGGQGAVERALLTRDLEQRSIDELDGLVAY